MEYERHSIIEIPKLKWQNLMEMNNDKMTGQANRINLDVTVAVCVKNGEGTLYECLSSLTKLDYPTQNLNLLVIDNGSIDKTQEIAREFPVRIVEEPIPGRGYARNAALKECTTALLAFTDADCRVAPDWISVLVQAFDDPEVAIAGGKIVTPGDDPLARFYEHRRVVSNQEFSVNHPFSSPFLATANAVFRTEILRAAGGFKTDYIVAEDADACWRVLDLGYRLRYIPLAVVYHHHRATLEGLWKQSVDYGFDGLVVFHRHANRFTKKYWIWWGLYFRLVISAVKILPSIFSRDRFRRLLPFYDLIRYTGLALGRIKAVWHLRIPGI